MRRREEGGWWRARDEEERKFAMPFGLNGRIPIRILDARNPI